VDGKMGISGLLPVLKEIQVHGNISEFKGKRLAVDVRRFLLFLRIPLFAGNGMLRGTGTDK